MNRRNFINASALAFPFMLSRVSAESSTEGVAVSPVDDGVYTDNDSDYLHWETSNNGDSRKKILMLEKGPGLEGRAILLRFKSGFRLRRHFHPAGELTFVLAGSFIQFEKSGKDLIPYEFKKGDTIWMPPNTFHEEAVALENGVTILSVTPKNVKF
jgi:quercetin dioxygenase-like cupin family protein